jgi:hypothetical protein
LSFARWTCHFESPERITSRIHISDGNYESIKASLIRQAAWLGKVEIKDIQLDLDLEGAMKKLYAKEVRAAQNPT